MNGMSLRQLRVFVAVAADGGIRVASDRLHLSQPAVSMALSELERQLGTELFDRERGRLHLNQRGRKLLPLARELLERAEEFERQASGSGGILSGELRLGASNTIGNYLVGELLGAFIAAHPEVVVRLSVDNTDAIVGGVREHRLDVGCVEGPVVGADLDTRAWRDDELVICTRPSDPLARRKRLRTEHFAGARWIVREPGSGTRAISERALGLLPAGEIVLELGQSEAIKQAVIAGMGIACLPLVAIADAVSAGRIVALRTPFLDLRRRMSWVTRRTTFRNPLFDALVARAKPQTASAKARIVKPPRRVPSANRNRRG